MRPKCLIVSDTSIRRSSAEVTSHRTGRASPPAAAMVRAVSLMSPEAYLGHSDCSETSLTVRDATTTCAPASP